MNIHDLAEQINLRSSSYNFGELQEIRKQIKGLRKKPTNKIFTSESISDDGWAFHIGGRSEIQFNIGFEDDGLRYGLAFSLEPSQSLPDVTILFPKILRLNSIYRERPELFSNYKLWYWSGKRSETFPMQEIPTDWIHPGCFIFFGKLMSDDRIDIEEILNVFDNMLPIYIEVESDNQNKIEEILKINTQDNFQFSIDAKRLPKNRTYTSVEMETNIDIRHSIIQKALYNKLIAIHGTENVSLENPFMGNKIDVVVKENNEYIFYEVKTGNSAKSCIRQALGQLFEYAYFPGTCHAKKIIIVGEHKIDSYTNNYIQYLQKHFNLPINYEAIIIED